jgi:hypothetical protein
MKTRKSKLTMTRRLLTLSLVMLLAPALTVFAVTPNELSRPDSTKVLQENSDVAYVDAYYELFYSPSDDLIVSASYTTLSAEAKETKVFHLMEVMEDEIILEDWMMNASHSSWNIVNTDCEDEIELEEWMTDLSQW